MATPSRPNASVSPSRQQLDELEALMQRMLALPVHPLEAESEPDPGRSADRTPSTSAPADPVEPPEPVRPYRRPEPIIPELPPLPPVQSFRLPQPPPPIVEAYRVTEPSPPTVESYRYVEPTEDDGLPPQAPYSTREPATPAADFEAEPPVPWRQDPMPEFPRPLILRHDLPEQPVDTDETDPLRPAVAPAPDVAAHELEWRHEPGPAWLRPLAWCNDTFDHCTGWMGPLATWLRSPGGRSTLGWIGLMLLATALVWGALDWMGWNW